MKNIKFILSIFLAAVVVLGMPYFLGASENISGIVVASMMVAPDPLRAAFSRAVELFKAQNGVSDISELGLQQFNIRMIKELSNTANSYTLDIKNKNATSTDLQNFEVLVPDKQHFFAAFMRVAYRKYDATNKLLLPVLSHEDANYLTVANELNSMYSLFNGTTDIITDNNGRAVNLTNDVFRRTPAQQYELVASAQPFWPAYGPSLEEKGYHQLAPNLIMDTNKVNQIKTFLKGYQAAIAGGANYNCLQVDIYGWLFGGVVPSGPGCSLGA